LIAAASRLAPAAGNARQPKKAVATSKRIIQQTSTKAARNNEVGAGKFLARRAPGLLR
jgi:hypothetical protein